MKVEPESDYGIIIILITCMLYYYIQGTALNALDR